MKRYFKKSNLEYNSYLYFFLFFILMICNFVTPIKGYSETIRINEFMALNQTVLTDEDGNTSDWIEIYNTSSDPVNLQGWSLSEDSSDLQLWTFPDVILNGNDYLIVFASSKNRVDPNGELHTNFRLNGNGEYLALSDPQGEIVTEFRPEYPPQFPDVSYGYHDGSYAFFTEPTPEAANQFSEHQLLSPPEFSVDHGFYETPFNVTLTTDVPGATIYYTTDASEPGEANGVEYTAPIQITTTTVLRAVVIDADASSSLSATQTYLFLDDVIHQPNDPEGYPAEWGPYTAIDGTAIADYEMDPEITQDPDYKDLLKESLLSIPTISIVSDIDNFFSHDEDPENGGIYIYTGPPIRYNSAFQVFGLGDGWERPGSVEFFNADGTKEFQANCGIRLQGGHSRRPEKSPKHSFRLIFRSEYGPTKLEYPLFGDEGAAEFNTVILRAGFCNKWFHHSADQRDRTQYLRDRWAKDTQLAMGHLSGRGFFAHLYVNGLYWGLYNPTERLDDDFAASYMGGDESDYDVIKDYTEVVDGEIDAWNAMMGIARSGLNNNETYQRIQGNNPDGTRNLAYEPYLDMVNFIDYIILNLYGGNTDWDSHNWAAIRNRVNPDKGFQFFSWDAEHVLKDIYQYVFYVNNYDCPSELFQLLRENDDFRRLFADRVQLHCFHDGVLAPESAAARYQERVTEIEMAVISESARWGDYRRDVHQNQPQGPFDLYTKNDHWLPALSFLLDDYFPNRPQAFIEQLRNENLYPDVNAPAFYINGENVTDNAVESGDILSMTATDGTIYYTTDGSDPIQSENGSEGEKITLFSQSINKRVLVPKSNIGTDWATDLNYDDSNWTLCSGNPGGVGFEKNNGYQNMISIDTGNDMHNDGTDPNPSCYIRIKFNVDQQVLSSIKSLQLSVLFDDGFVAYLNGAEVAGKNVPGYLVWNSSASDNHEAEFFETFDISDNLDKLTAGENLLAIQALNRGTSSSDFIINVYLEGSDKASTNGTVSSGARAYSDPITLIHSAYIKARTLSGNTWSALTSSMYTISGDIQNLKVTEIHYHPLPEEPVDDREFEFIELKNIGKSSIDLKGVQFVNGIDYTFSKRTVLSPGAFLVLASNQVQFASRYEKEAFDEYEGNLNNGGERIVIVDSQGDTLFSVRYNDQDNWPVSADGGGYSLVPAECDPIQDQSDPGNWQASYNIHGSPGENDPVFSGADNSTLIDCITLQLMQNYPNPFNPVTQIHYIIPEASLVKLSIFDVLGREVRVIVNEHQGPNEYSVQFDASDLSSGIYFYVLKTENHLGQKKKMLLIK